MSHPGPKVLFGFLMGSFVGFAISPSSSIINNGNRNSTAAHVYDSMNFPFVVFQKTLFFFGGGLIGAAVALQI